MERKYNVAVIGATGAVGESVFALLQEREFPVGEIFPVASSESAGKRLQFGDGYRAVENIHDFDFSQAELALFCTPETVSTEYVPLAVDAGCIVIDSSAAFRYDNDVPLVVPQVNDYCIHDYRQRGIIASPGALAAQLALTLKPLHDAACITRINTATYQAVSAIGKKGVEELSGQTARLLNAQPADSKSFPRQIAFNVFPQVDQFLENGYTREEIRLVLELRKLFEDENLLINPTAVQVPVFYGNSQAVHLETREHLPIQSARDLLLQREGIELLDELENGGYPTPVSESSGSDNIFVGRVRQDISHPHGMDLWIVSDNVRKGAALNSVEIAELLIKNFE